MRQMDGADPPTAPRALQFCSILSSRLGEYGEHGEHEKYEKHQPDDLKHSIFIHNDADITSLHSSNALKPWPWKPIRPEAILSRWMITSQAFWQDLLSTGQLSWLTTDWLSAVRQFVYQSWDNLFISCETIYLLAVRQFSFLDGGLFITMGHQLPWILTNFTPELIILWGALVVVTV